ncbi:YdeI/OmpD-associated family protein [Gemmatimonas sp.]|uniref:YdeI/OmpD-associated family protein n=1 Tax=Gemmatimonas sp. TaxID=1962908 RepID=UPI003DA35211
MPITVGATLRAPTRAACREWLIAHHADKGEVWLVADDRPDVPTVDYLDAVEEALCFGWIDSIAKRLNPTERIQRFSPRRAKSHWTELNKARATTNGWRSSPLAAGTMVGGFWTRSSYLTPASATCTGAHAFRVRR